MSEVRSVLFQLLEECNYRCSHCSQDAPHVIDSAHRTEIPLEVAKHRIRHLHGLGLSRMRFTGGEPLLYPWLFDLIEFATELMIKCSIVTNGSLLRAKTTSIVASGLDSVWISLYGINEASYRALAGRRSPLPALCGAVRELHEGGVAVGAYCPIRIETIDGDFSLLQAVVDAGLGSVKFMQLMDQGRYASPVEHLSPEQVREGLRSILRFLRHNAGIEVRVSVTSSQRQIFIDEGWELPDFTGCSAGQPDSWAISANGGLHTCCLLMNDKAMQEGLVQIAGRRAEILNKNQRTAEIGPCEALPGYTMTSEGDFICPLVYARRSLHHEP